MATGTNSENQNMILSAESLLIAGVAQTAALSTAAQTIAGAKTFSTMPIIPTATVAAAGSVQADAAAITTGFTLVTAADATKGVKLPTAAAGLVAIIKNSSASALKVWPFVGDGINAVAVDSNYSMAANTASLYVAYDATTWYSLPLVAS